MGRNRKLLSLAATVILASLSKLAMAAEMPTALDQYTRQPEHMTAVMSHVHPYYDAIPSCKPGTAKRINLIPLGPITFNTDGSLLAGRWKEVIKIDGCVTSGLFNVMTATDSAGIVHVVGMLPGTSIGALALQRDAFGYASITARSLAAKQGELASCQQLIVLDTTFSGFGEAINKDVPAGRDPRSWRERWTIKVCGTEVPVNVNFVPDATGTSISTGP